MKILENKKQLTKVMITGHVDSSYRDMSEDDVPEFYFDEFGYEKDKYDLADEFTKWEIDINNNTDVAIFKDAYVDDAYFTNVNDGDTGIIELYVEIESNDPLQKSDLQYISDSLMEYIVDDASVYVEGTWYGEQEYWDGVSYEPSYRDASGDIRESGRVELDKSAPITYKILN